MSDTSTCICYSHNYKCIFVFCFLFYTNFVMKLTFRLLQSESSFIIPPCPVIVGYPQWPTFHFINFFKLRLKITFDYITFDSIVSLRTITARPVHWITSSVSGAISTTFLWTIFSICTLETNYHNEIIIYSWIQCNTGV